MIYPNFLRKNDTIGITAPSAGITDYGKLKRLDNAKLNIENLGFNIIETNNSRTNIKGRSSSSLTRASELMNLWTNDKVKVIIPVSGGDFGCETLDNLDFNKLKQCTPKWIQGYSDSTILTFLSTTILDTASIYCENFRTIWNEKLT